MDLPPEWAAVTEPKRPRPFVRVGNFVRAVRNARGLKSKEVALKAEIDPGLMTRIEKGENVELQQYDKVARALGFRGPLEMFRSEPNPLTRELLKLWRALQDDEEAQKELLAQVRDWIDAREG